MVVKKKFTASGIGEKAARNIRSIVESAAAEGKNAQTPEAASSACVSVSSACVSASYPRVPAGRKLTPQEEDALKQAELDLLSHNYPDKQGLELVCEFGSPELLQKHLFFKKVINPNNTTAWGKLLARTDIPELLSFVKNNLERLSYNSTLCHVLLLKGNDEIVEWFVKTGYRNKNEHITLPTRCLYEKSLQERSLKDKNFKLRKYLNMIQASHVTQIMEEEKERKQLRTPANRRLV